MIRNGQQYRDSIRDGRQVWINGERVRDVTTHAMFKPLVDIRARIYDMAHEAAHAPIMAYRTESGEPCSVGTKLPLTQQDWHAKRDAVNAVLDEAGGIVTRVGDETVGEMWSLYDGQDVLNEVNPQFSANIRRHVERVVQQDPFHVSANTDPKGDRSKRPQDQDPDMLLHVVKETDAGIIVRGARMLATLGPVSDEMIMYNLPGFRPGDEDHAIMFAVPTDVPGLRQICRTPYDRGTQSSFDHPLASRFEESDALLIFDDVLVPWERVFLYRDVALCNAIYPDTALRNHTAHQTNTRALVKLQFAVGLAIAVARSIKADQFLHVQQMLGECLGYVEIVKSALVRAEAEFETMPSGTVRAALPPLQALRAFLPAAYPRIIEVLQTIGAGGLMMMPSGADFAAAGIAQDVGLYYQGASGMASRERVKLFKLAWDLCGDAFGSRQLQ